MFVVFALLGLRRSEVFGLQWADLDLENGWLQVRRGLQRMDGQLIRAELKTQRSHRTVPLPALVVDALKKHAEAQDKDRVELAERWPKTEYVFTTSIGTPISLATARGSSRTSVSEPAYVESAFTTSGTASFRCSLPWECLLPWRSSATPRSR